MAREEPKTIVSMSIDIDLLEAINAEIAALKQTGVETNFSLWMRDAVRRKLRRFRARESQTKYKAKRT